MQIIKSGVIVASFTLISRIFGYIRDILMASYLGLHFDAFAVAFRLPNTFRTLFAEGAFSAAFVPMFSAKLAPNNKEDAFTFASQIFSLLFIILLLFIGAMMLFMPNIISILAPGFIKDQEKFLLTISLAYFTTPYLFFISLASLYTGVMNSCGKFAVAAALPIILNLVMILAIIFLTPLSVTPSHALSYGVFIAGISQFATICYAVHRADIHIGFTKIVITDDLKMMFRNMLPVIIGSGVVQINLAVGTIIASFIDGAASILYMADRLNQFPLAIIGTALGTVLLPALSKQLKENKLKEAMATQGKALELALFFALPCAFALGVISDTLISFLFERGNFNAQDSFKVANALSALAVGLPAFIMIKIFTPRYFAQYDTTTPVKISAVCIVANIILSIALSQVYSYVGIAMATSISAWINVSLLYYFQYKRKIFIIEKKSLIYIGKVFCSCLLMIIALILFERIDFTISSAIYNFIIFVSEILFGSVV